MLTAGMAAMATVLLTQPAGAVVIPEDVQFLQSAHAGNLAEIDAGEQALVSGGSQTVRDIGATMVADHTRLDTTVRNLAAQLDIALPMAPDPEQQAVAARLQQASGTSFDPLFIATQLDAHTTALADAQTEISRGGDPRVVAAAHSAAPVIEKHRQMLLAASGQNSRNHT
jgi:putative membrane protein